jgi:hypothetical protein
MATSNKSKKILEKARKVAAKTKKKKVSKVDVKKKTTSFPEGQNAPQSKRYTQEADKSLGAKNTGWRWTKEGAKKLGKDANAKPSQSDIETYRNETFKLKGKPNKSGPKGVGDGSHRYLYIERRADKADIKRSQKLAKGGEVELEIKNLDSFDKHYDEVEFTEEELSLPYQKDGKWFVKTSDKGIAKQLKQDGFVKDSFAKGGETKDAWGVFYNGKLMFTESSQDEANKSAKMLKSQVDMPFGVSVEKIESEKHAKGGYMAKGGITKDELNNFKSYVKKFYGNDGIYDGFFPPTGASNDEIELAIRMYVSYCKTKDDQWAGGDPFDVEIVRDVMLYNRGHKTNLEYQRAVKEIVKHYKNKSFEYGGILQPMIGGVNADPRFDIYNTTMFAKDGAELPKGEKMRRGGFVTTMDDLIASADLIGEAEAKMKEGDFDQVLNFAYTDYGGDFFDKVAIEFFLENYPDNIVVENTMYSGKNAIVFGEPAREFAEASERYILGFDNIEDYYYQMQYEQEREDFERFLDDMEKYNNYKVSKEALDWLLENKSGYYSILPSGLDYSESDLEEELVNEGLLEKNEEMAKGGETKDGKIKFYKVADEIRNLEYDGDPHDKRLHSETTFSWGAKDEDEYERAEKLIGKIGEKGNGWEVYATFDYSGYGYWMKQMREPNYIRLAVIFKDSYVDENEIGRIESALYEAIMEAERISNAFDYDPSEDKDDDDYAKGGKTKEQGYDDREDESLAMRHGKISSKDFVGSHHKKEHSRRDDAQFETRD